MRGAVALVTDADHAALTSDDQLLLPALAHHGLQGVPVAWDDAHARWQDFSAVVIRSTWDYFRRYATFVRWLDQLQAAGARVFNPVATLRWNSDKSYLRQLAAAGIPVMPTAWLARGEGEPLSRLMAQRGWHDIVVKPTVSGGAWKTWRVAAPLTAADDRRLDEVRRERDLMVQPFEPAIASAGELSLVFVGGDFSHAVLKRPAAGDFRVQEEAGGSSAAVSVDASLIAQASRALEAAPTPCLYARVDGCLVEGRFVLMELEVLEPSLFLAHAPGAAARLAAAIAQRAGGNVASNEPMSGNATTR